MKKKQWFRSPAVTALMLVAAIGLLAFAGIGGAQAALSIQSQNYISQVSMEDIGVSLWEEDTRVANRDYVFDQATGNSSWTPNVYGTLSFPKMTEEGDAKAPILNKKYPEKLSVSNSGHINEYLRVTIYRYWIDEQENKATDRDPKLIELYYGTGEDAVNLDEAARFGPWIKDTNSDTKERMVLYYNTIMAPGADPVVFADQIAINNEIATKVKQVVEGNTITTVYLYDGYQFCLDVAVDAVQDHNAADAIKSAWGIDAAAVGLQVG